MLKTTSRRYGLRARHAKERCPRGVAEPQRNSNADYANAPPPTARRDGSPHLGGTYGGTSGAAGGRTTPPFSRAGSPRSQDSAQYTWHLCDLPFVNNCQLQIVDNSHLRPCVSASLRPCVFLSLKVRKDRKDGGAPPLRRTLVARTEAAPPNFRGLEARAPRRRLQINERRPPPARSRAAAKRTIAATSQGA